VIVPEILKLCRDVAVQFAVPLPVLIVIACDAGLNENPALLGVPV
jgi:hypothetical protein